MGDLCTPVLAVAPGAQDAQDALQLWSLFSKCKDSLQDGRRLENISWRLTWRDISRRRRLPGPLEVTWPPTPESISSDDSGGTKSTTSTTTSSVASPFFLLPPRKPMATSSRSAGQIICDMIPPGLTQKLTQHMEAKDSKKLGYPTPASSSSSSVSMSSSAVSIAIQAPPSQEPENVEVVVPRVVILTATPNLSPHPTPPTTPLLTASAPSASRALSPPSPTLLPSAVPSIVYSNQQHSRKESPGPLLLPHSATRAMGLPVTPAIAPYSIQTPASVAYTPQSTHILPLGGRDLGSGCLVGHSSGKCATRGTGRFFLQAAASASSHSSSRSRSSGTSNSYDNERENGSRSSGSGSESSRERSEGDGNQSAPHAYAATRGAGSSRGRGRGWAESGGHEREMETEQKIQRQAQVQTEHQQHPDPVADAVNTNSQPKTVGQQQHQQTKPPISPPQLPLTKEPQKPARAASAPFLGGVGLGLKYYGEEATDSGGYPHNNQALPIPKHLQSTPPSNSLNAQAPADTEDARSVSSHATSSSKARVRARAKQPTHSALRGQQSQSRSRSRKAGTRASHNKEGSGNAAPNELGLPSNLAAAAALVERQMGGGRRKIELATSDEDDSEWSDDEDVSREGEGAESIEGEVEGDDGEGGWEDESDSPEESRRGNDADNARARAHPNAKAPPPSLQQHARRLGHTRVHSTDGGDTGTELRHLPTRPTHRSAGNLPALARAAPTKHNHPPSAQNARTERALKATMGANALSDAMLEAQRQRELFAKVPRVSYENIPTLAASRPGGLTLLLGGRQVTEHQEQLGQMPPPRQRHAGGFGGLGLTMTAPPVAGPGGAQLSPIPPTPATALEQPQQPVTGHQPQELSPIRQPQGAPPPRRPNIPRALSSSALPPHLSTAGISGSLGKSSVARPVITSPVEGSSTSTQTQNGSAGRGAYRPKGPPAELEYDDDDESDADGRGKGKERASDGGLQVSKSVAQEKLRVLAEKSAILSRAKNGPGSDADATVAERRRLYEQAGVAEWAPVVNGQITSDNSVAHAPSNQSTSTAPVGFPYYLPAPEPPSTPRTTRKHMLRNEMSESLRYNLLWQRKLSRTELTGPQPRRTRSTVHVPSAEKSLVRVTPRAPGAERRDAPLPPMDQSVLEGAPKKKLVRNLSWANTSDFHWKGY